jgi:hypothetical protein
MSTITAQIYVSARAQTAIQDSFSRSVSILWESQNSNVHGYNSLYGEVTDS